MHLLKQLWVRSLRRARDEYEEAQDDIEHSSPLFRFVLLGFALYVLLSISLGIYWSSSPSLVEPDKVTHDFLRQENIPSQTLTPVGVTSAATLMAVTETLWTKPGGYLSNDMFPPGLWLDDMPNWELGVLLQIRDFSSVLRGTLSQDAAHSVVDDDLQKAEVRFNFANQSWIFPATESQYKAGVEHVQKYAIRLVQGTNNPAHFYATAENLNAYLIIVEQRLQNLSQRLAASIGPKINTDMAAMSATTTSDGDLITNGLYKKTPWLKIDDVFYEARGSSWALIALLQSVQQDFTVTLHDKKANASYEQIIRELKPTQQTIFSPVILNGKDFGFVANHSLVMSSYLARAQAAVADCRRLLLAPSP